jgi:hypothetical protein
MYHPDDFHKTWTQYQISKVKNRFLYEKVTMLK